MAAFLTTLVCAVAFAVLNVALVLATIEQHTPLAGRLVIYVVMLLVDSCAVAIAVAWWRDHIKQTMRRHG